MCRRFVSRFGFAAHRKAVIKDKGDIVIGRRREGRRNTGEIQAGNQQKSGEGIGKTTSPEPAFSVNDLIRSLSSWTRNDANK